MAGPASSQRRYTWAVSPLPVATTALLALAALAATLLSPQLPLRLVASAGGCGVAYSVPSSWPGGFTGSVTITNTGPAITSWTLAFTFPGDQQVTSGWDGTWSQSGENVTVTNESWNGALATGGSTNVGFNGSFTGGNTSPASFSVNGVTCGASPPPSTSPAPSTSPTPTPTPTAPPGVTLATGDSRRVSQPSIPAACTTLTAQLSTSNEQFSSAAEQSPPDTSRLQSALTSCAGSNKAVVLAASGSSTAFLSGPLTLPGGVTLVIDDGVTLYASRNPANYQISGKNTCGGLGSSDNGCSPFINVTGSNSAIMGVRGSDGSQGIINGRGDQDILGTSGSWWDLSQSAKSAGDDQNNPRLIEAHGVNNITLYDIDLVNAPIFHVYFESGNGLTLWGVRIKTPATARNTDGLDADSATNVTVNDSYLMDGDDGIAIKTNSGAASNMTVENSHFYGTHGMSIGSETNHGVSNILFTNNTVSGVDSAGNVSGDNNGIRIKTDSSVGGTVQQVTYENTCVTQTKHAIELNPFYASGNGSTTPFYTDIVVLGFKAVSSVSGAQSVLEGYNSSHPLGLTLENVSLDATSTSAEFANIGVFNSNVTPSGTGVAVTNISGSGSVPACTFPSYPGL